MKNWNQNHKALTLAQRERLAILSEECAEVIKAVSKTLRHGFHPIVKSLSLPAPITYNNRADIENELGDVLEAMDRLVRAGDLHQQNIEASRATKDRKQYLHYQPNDGSPPQRPASQVRRATRRS